MSLAPDNLMPLDKASSLIEKAVLIDHIDQAILVFHDAYQSAISGADALLADKSLGRSHHKVLYHVARHPRCSVNEIREFLKVSRQAMQRPINDLHRLGMIELVAAPNNRRTHLLVLTEIGAEWEATVSGLLRERFDLAFKNMSRIQIQHWFEVMQAFSA